MREIVLNEVVEDVRALSSRMRAEYAFAYHYVFAMLACLRAAGCKDLDYGRLAVESGVGLGFGYRRNSCMHVYALQAGATERIAAATGGRLECMTCESPEDAWAWTVASLDAGSPVAAEYYEFHVVAGYRDGGAAEDRQWYVLANEPVSPFDGAWLDWAQIERLYGGCPWSRQRYRVADKSEACPAAETATQVVRWLVEWAERHPGQGQERYQGAQFGTEGIEAYARDLADMSLTVEADFDWGNNACHAITPQWVTRRYIGNYLERHVPLFPETARVHLLEAVEGYYAAYASWIAFDEALGQRYVRQYGGEQEVGWADPVRRGRGADAVYQAAAHERRALAELREALATL